MAWWGKLVGGAVGFMIGGPIGALLGGALGHNIDNTQAKLTRGGGFNRKSQERTQAAFFAATFSVMGHVAKADGRVSEQEIAMAQQLMSHMKLNKMQRKIAINLFNQGKSDDFNLDQVLTQFKRECGRKITLIQMFMEVQVQAAFADNVLDTKESAILQHIAQNLGFTQAQLNKIINMVKASITSQSGNQMSLEQAYKILNVNEKMTTNEIKKSYRRLLSQHHPDKLVAKGLPEEMIKLANEKTYEIRSAWKLIQKERGAIS